MDGLRFVAIGMVVLFHLNDYLETKSTLQYSPVAQADWLGQIAAVGFRGVELFFVISGFILGLPFAEHLINGAPAVRLRSYYLRRLTRLEPPYFIAMFLIFALLVLVKRESASDLFPHLGASLLYVHNLIYGSHSKVMDVAWSLEIEVQFYLLVPLLTAIFGIENRVIRRGLLVASVVLLLAAQSLLVPSPRAALSILAYLQYFLIGFLIADIYATDWKEAPSRSTHWDVVALAGWLLLPFMLRSSAFAHWLFPFLIALLYCAAFRGRLTNFCFTRPWLTVIGGMCYSVYLLHYGVISLVGRLTLGIAVTDSYWIRLLIQVLLVGPPILLICGLYFFILEKPCMRRDWPQRLVEWLARGPRTQLT